MSDAALHDSQAVDHLLMRGNTGAGVWADAAYRSEAMEAKLHDRTLKSHIHRKGKRGKPPMGGTLVRTIGMARAMIGMKNIAYNMRRLTQLRRLTPCPA